jgi:hypothetical protein
MDVATNSKSGMVWQYFSPIQQKGRALFHAKLEYYMDEKNDMRLKIEPVCSRRTGNL